jgi:hypothetical protein
MTKSKFMFIVTTYILDCSYNQFWKLEIPDLSELTSLICNDNPYLYDIKMSPYAPLQGLNCTNCNLLFTVLSLTAMGGNLSRTGLGL